MGQGWTLVGDIGGTNARFALVADGTKQLTHIEKKACADYPNFMEAVQSYISAVGIKPSNVSLATAGPVSSLDEVITFTNNPWEIKRKEMLERLNLDGFKVVNDFVANALSIPELEEYEKVCLGNVCQVEAGGSGPVLVLGPGTGLGMASLVNVDGVFMPLPAEGGHVSFAPTTEEEVEIWRALKSMYGRVSVERLLSGQGLLDLFNIKSQIHQWGVQADTPAHVTSLSEEKDANALQVVRHFSKILGDVAGDAALTIGSFGGVYICGGIAPRILNILQEGAFREAFENKGRMKHFVDSMPTWIVTADYPGLLGSLAAMRNVRIA